MLFKPTVITAAPPHGRAATQAVYSLYRGHSQRVLVRVVPYGALYRIEWPDIGFSDITNLTRAKAAALEWAERKVLTESRNLPVARRLKSLNFFWRSSSYVAANPAGVP